MPYNRLDDLPDSVKNNLPHHAQEIYKEAYNSAFIHNWEYYPLSDRELDYAVDNAIQVVIPELLQIILNQDDDIVGFVLPFPDVSAAMQKNKGKLGPIELFRLLRELKTTEWLDFNGIGILETELLTILQQILLHIPTPIPEHILSI